MKDKEYLLTKLGFKRTTIDGRISEGYWNKKYKNGDFHSVCLTDGSEGGFFGAKGWELVQLYVDRDRRILRAVGILHDLTALNPKTKSLEKDSTPENALRILGSIPLSIPSHPHLSNLPPDQTMESVQKAYKIVEAALRELRAYKNLE